MNEFDSDYNYYDDQEHEDIRAQNDEQDTQCLIQPTTSDDNFSVQSCIHHKLSNDEDKYEEGNEKDVINWYEEVNREQHTKEKEIADY